MGKIILDIKNLKTYYFIPGGIVKAVDGISFKIKEGEALGIIGESGSGKSTVGWSIIGLLSHPGKIVEGEIFIEDQNILKLDSEEMREIRGKKISMITQSSMNSLNPLMKIDYQIMETILVNENISKSVAIKRTENILENVGLEPSSFKKYPHELSGGMKQRAIIAMALVCRPKLIIADEPTTALDVIVKAQILKLLDDLMDGLESSSIIFISHDLSTIVEICDNIIIMYGGKMMEFATTSKIIKNPLHPYTKGLLKSYPHIEKEEISLESIPGSPPNMVNLPKGCVFSPRCIYSKNICFKEPAKMTDVGDNHLVVCHLIQEREVLYDKR